MNIKKLNEIDIYNYIAVKITGYFSQRTNLDSQELKKLHLGVMVILLNIYKMFIVFVAAFFLGILKETVILFSMFAVIRIYAAGMHLKSDLSCTIACLVLYLGSTLIAVKYPLDIVIVFYINIFLICILFKYSPADTEKRPILGRKHRKRLKIKTISVSIILLILNGLLMDKIIFNLLMYAFLIEVICVNPFTYKVLKLKYNNYEEFEE